VESETETAKLKLPVELGVPEIAPVVELRSTPVGSWPEATEKVYGCVPPLTLSVAS
jgi:hypothetical protein